MKEKTFRKSWIFPKKSDCIICYGCNSLDPPLKGTVFSFAIQYFAIIHERVNYLKRYQHLNVSLLSFPTENIYKLHKLSRFRTFQDQLLVSYVRWLTDDEFYLNQAKIHQKNSQIHFCSRSSFGKSPQNHQHVIGIQSNLYQEWYAYHISHQKLPARQDRLCTPL